MVGKVHLTRQASIEELRGRYRSEKNPRIKERLLAILHLYEGKMVKEVSKIVKRSERAIERWLAEWKEKRYDVRLPHLWEGRSRSSQTASGTRSSRRSKTEE